MFFFVTKFPATQQLCDPDSVTWQSDVILIGSKHSVLKYRSLKWVTWWKLSHTWDNNIKNGFRKLLNCHEWTWDMKHLGEMRRLFWQVDRMWALDFHIDQWTWLWKNAVCPERSHFMGHILLVLILPLPCEKFAISSKWHTKFHHVGILLCFACVWKDGQSVIWWKIIEHHLTNKAKWLESKKIHQKRQRFCSQTNVQWDKITWLGGGLGPGSGGTWGGGSGGSGVKRGGGSQWWQRHVEDSSRPSRNTAALEFILTVDE